MKLSSPNTHSPGCSWRIGNKSLLCQLTSPMPCPPHVVCAPEAVEGQEWAKAQLALSVPRSSSQPSSYVSNAWRSICFFWAVRRVGNWMSKKMKRSPFFAGSSGNGIPSPGTFLKYLGLRREDERKQLRASPRAALRQAPGHHSSQAQV